MPNYLKERPYFQPDKNALEQWLRTRKSKKPVHGYNLPGFFSTEAFFWDSVLFFIGFAIEVAIFGFFLTLVQIDDITNWVIFPLLIIVDIVFALMLVHNNKASNIKYENAVLFLDEDQNPLVAETVKRDSQLKNIFKISRGNFLSSLGIILEFVSMGLKIYFIHVAYTLTVEPISMAVIVGYVLQTIFYINSTGYFFSEISLIRFLNSQYKKFDVTDRKEYSASPKDDLFDTSIPLKPCENTIFKLEYSNHPTDNPEDATKKSYKITCFGVPLDSDIVDFAELQITKEARKQVMYQAHKLQLIKFQSVA